MAYNEDNTGVLFKNDRKEPGDKRPDYKGHGNFGGVDFDISAWIRTSTKDGSKFMSIQFQPPYKKPQSAPAVQSTAFAPPVDDDVPF